MKFHIAVKRILAKKFHISFVIVRYKNFYPHVIGKEEYYMEKIKNTSKSGEKAEAIKVACENNGIYFEHRGTFWEGNAGEVLFNLRHMRWTSPLPRRLPHCLCGNSAAVCTVPVHTWPH